MSHYFYITPEEYEQAARNGVRPKLLEVRIRLLAWPKKKAINTPPHKKKPLKEWVELAEQNGICYSTLRKRVNQMGWDPIRAATQPLHDRKAQMKVAQKLSRKYPEAVLQQARKNGIRDATFYMRIKRGWDLETASTRPPMTKSEQGLLTKEKRQISLRLLFLPRAGKEKKRKSCRKSL